MHLGEPSAFLWRVRGAYEGPFARRASASFAASEGDTLASTPSAVSVGSVGGALALGRPHDGPPPSESARPTTPVARALQTASVARAALMAGPGARALARGT